MIEKLVIGISGASGAPIAIALLKELRRSGIGTHLVISRRGELTIDQETRYGLEEVKRLAGIVYDNQDLGASLTSGNFKTPGMAVVPCSMETLTGIHGGYSDGLLLRAADATIEERRRLVLVTRECPLSPVHLRNIYELPQMGAVILPPVISYYQRPEIIEEMAVHVVGKIVDRLGLECQPSRCWEG